MGCLLFLDHRRFFIQSVSDHQRTKKPPHPKVLIYIDLE